MAAIVLTLTGSAVASASTNTYSASYTGPNATFDVSEALFYAQQKGVAAGYSAGQCPESSRNVQPYGTGFIATVYVDCYRPDSLASAK